jgi:hypothetical protein
MTPGGRFCPGADLPSRLARDMAAALAPVGLGGSDRGGGGGGVPRAPRPTPWGVEYGGVVVATAVPPRSTVARWPDRPVIAASAALQMALAEVGVVAVSCCMPPLVASPDASVAAGDHSDAVVRCDDAVVGSDEARPPKNEARPPEGDAVAIGAFLLCWALDAPRARLILAHPAAAALAASLGCPGEPVGPHPAVVICGGTSPCPPPLIVDALAAGIPVVGRRTAALAAVVGDAGLLVDPGDGVEALAEALGALLRDPRLATEVGRHGPLRVEALDPAAGLRSLLEDLARHVGPAGAPTGD